MKKIITTIVLVLVSTFSFAQSAENLGEQGDYTIRMGKEVSYVYTEDLIAVKGIVQPIDLTIYYYKSTRTVRMIAFYDEGNTFKRDQKVELILDGDKDTYVKEDGVLTESKNLSIQLAVNKLGIFKVYKGEYIHLKVGNNITKISLVGLRDALNVLIEASDAKIAAENPFDNNEDNPFTSNGNDNDSTEKWLENNGLENLNPFFLEQYLQVFLQDADDNGIDVSHVNLNSINLEFKVDDSVGRSTIAYTDTMNNDNRVHVVVNPTRWNAASPQKRLAIFYHELGHDILNFDHDAEEGPLMSVYAREDYTYEELFKLRNQMFQDFKNGVAYNIEDE